MRILSVNIPVHDASVALLDDNNIICLEEERHTRIRSYIDYHRNMITFPTFSFRHLQSIENLSNDTIDYIASCNNNISDFIRDIYGVDIDKSKCIKVDHHLAHAATAYYWSGFEEDTLVVVLDGGADNNMTGRFYVAKGGNLHEIGRAHV